ncbi:MAG: hypothetical protein LQ341_007014 [Variospora aurantia]|nr:MAG: hypothetical protein LQ341_007014 [Variospora aurantia]
MDAVQWHQDNINITIGELEQNASRFELAPWCEYDWYDLVLPGCSFNKVHQRRRLRDHSARGRRILGELELLLRVTSRYPDLVARLRGEVGRLGVRLDHISYLDMMSEGIVMLSPILHEQINGPKFTWLRPAWVPSPSDPQDSIMTPRRYSYNLGQIGNSDVSLRLSWIARLCQMSTNRGMIHGGLHLICNFWSFARTFSPPGGDPLDGVQRSWLQERDAAISRYRKKVHADDANMIRRVAAAWSKKARRIPEYLD